MYRAIFAFEADFSDGDALRAAFGCQDIDLRPGSTVRLIGEISLDRSVVFEGDCRLEGPVSIQRGSILTNVRLGAGAQVRPYSILADFSAGARNILGPFCFIRDGCITGDEVILGAHVEAARSRFSSYVKVSHRAFIGDADIGEGSIVGAGVVFCNYADGQRHATKIGAGVTIGSGSLLVAPLWVGDRVIIAAGSVATKDLPDDSKLLQRR